MSKLRLDDVEWKTFRLKEIFEIENCKCSKVSALKSGEIPYVGATNRNNGTIGYIEYKEKLLTKGNCIVFVCDGEGSIGYSFYKAENFIGTTTVKVGRNDKLNKYSGMFLSTVADTVRGKYNFGYKRNEFHLKNETLQLPVDIQGNPNWQFMEDYIKQEMKVQSKKVVRYYENKLLKLGFASLDLDVEWKEFRIRDIFEVKTVKGKVVTSYKIGEIPYITTSSLNNGLNNFIDTNEDISDENCISIEPIGGKAFYHDYKFVGRGGAGSAINILYNDNLDNYTGLFISQLIEKSSKTKASYGVQLNGNRLKNLKFLLPVDQNGTPHWDYMRLFMQKIEKENIEKSLEYIYRITNVLKDKYELSTTQWNEYFIEEICEIKSGVRLTKNNQIDGLIPFVGSIDSNNGITNFIKNVNNSLDENILGVNYNGSVVETFYHSYNSVFSDDVKRVCFKEKHYNNEYTLLFLKQMIIQQKEKYQYGYKFNGKRMSRQKIMLPSTTDGTPNYDFMEKYMIIQEINTIKNSLDYLTR